MSNWLRSIGNGHRTRQRYPRFDIIIRCSAVITRSVFSKILRIVTPNLPVKAVFCEGKPWLMFCLCYCSDICIIVLYCAALSRHRTVFMVNSSRPSDTSAYASVKWDMFGSGHGFASVRRQIITRGNATLVLQANFRQWTSCQIHKIAGAHARGMLGTFSPSPQVSDPDMHHGTCVTHVPWCMPGSLNSGFLWKRRRGKTFPAFPAHAQPAILRIW